MLPLWFSITEAGLDARNVLQRLRQHDHEVPGDSSGDNSRLNYSITYYPALAMGYPRTCPLRSLPRGEPICLAIAVPLNDNGIGHPFVYESYCVAVTGTLPPLADHKDRLRGLIDPRVFVAVQEETISAYLGALYVTIMAKRWGWEKWRSYHDFDSLSDCLLKTVKLIYYLNQDQRRRAGDGTPCGSSLEDPKPAINLTVTDGNDVIACRFRGNPAAESPHLAYLDRSGGADGKKDCIVISGDRWRGSSDNWKELDENKFLTIPRNNADACDDFGFEHRVAAQNPWWGLKESEQGWVDI